MLTRDIYFKLTGIVLAAAFIFSACGTAATTVAPAPIQPTPTASPVPVLPTPTASPLPVLPSATATSTPLATETSSPTIAAAPTATTPITSTLQSVAQVIPSVNAYCRQGPGSDYNIVTYLISGTAYNVVGRNSLNTWWLVQVPGNLTCWTGASGTTQLGPVEQVSIVLAPPALLPPSLFEGSYICDTQNKTLEVTLNWSKVPKATGYRLYRNGVLLAVLGADGNGL